eukprot:6089857-Amphidinium_carterae.3
MEVRNQEIEMEGHTVPTMSTGSVRHLPESSYTNTTREHSNKAYFKSNSPQTHIVCVTLWVELAAAPKQSGYTKRRITMAQCATCGDWSNSTMWLTPTKIASPSPAIPLPNQSEG